GPEVEEPVGRGGPGEAPDVLGGALPREISRRLPPLRRAVLVRGELVKDDRAPGAADRLAEVVPGDRDDRGAGAEGPTARGRGPGGDLDPEIRTPLRRLRRPDQLRDALRRDDERGEMVLGERFEDGPGLPGSHVEE